MRKFNFGLSECLEIINVEQFNEARHLLRNPNMEYNGPFPVYFEHAYSVSRGSSIGIIFEPVDTWKREPLTVRRFDDSIDISTP